MDKNNAIRPNRIDDRMSPECPKCYSNPQDNILSTMPPQTESPTCMFHCIPIAHLSTSQKPNSSRCYPNLHQTALSNKSDQSDSAKFSSRDPHTKIPHNNSLRYSHRHSWTVHPQILPNGPSTKMLINNIFGRSSISVLFTNNLKWCLCLLLLLVGGIVPGAFGQQLGNRTEGQSSTQDTSCVSAKIKCAFRDGCGKALEAYMLDCSDLMHGKVDYCEEACKNSLIALTSTDAGYNLMTCVCGDGYCQDMKDRLDVCREEVMAANAREAIVTCRIAHIICAADPQCSIALAYYDRRCRRMFQGRSCTSRCNNSISILQRQEKAQKLETCICDGSESFDCPGIKANMAKLCFNQYDDDDIEKQEEETNEIDTTSKYNKSPKSTSKSNGINLMPNVILMLWLSLMIVSLTYQSDCR